MRPCLNKGVSKLKEDTKIEEQEKFFKPRLGTGNVVELVENLLSVFLVLVKLLIHFCTFHGFENT